MPRGGDIRHRRHDDDEADQRPFDHDLAAVTIAEAAPRRREQRRQPRRHRQADAGPHGDSPDIGDAQLPDVERQKRHGQREAGVAHERRRRHRRDVPFPRLGRRRGDRGQL